LKFSSGFSGTPDIYSLHHSRISELRQKIKNHVMNPFISITETNINLNNQITRYLPTIKVGLKGG